MLFVFDYIHVSLHDDQEQQAFRTWSYNYNSMLPDNDKGASPDLREQIAYM